MAALPDQVKARFDALDPVLATRLKQLRTWIFDVAAADDNIGPLEETLKWGQPSYLTGATKSGTTIRLDQHGKSGQEYALYVHCQTSLVERYRELYRDELRFEGSRAIIFHIDDEIPEQPVRHCIAMALTYHLRGKK